MSFLDNRRKCVGCGHCCLTAICLVGYTYLNKGKSTGPIKRCTLLYWSKEQGRYRCTLAEKGTQFKIALHVGEGCPQGLNTWRKEVKFRG